jgi:pimeloyl-[acyl-carrier protein] methyl ester esterase
MSTTPCFVERHDWPYGVKKNFFNNFELEAKKSINDTLMKFFLIQTKDIKNAKDTMKFLKSNFIKSTDHNTLGMRGALKILGETDLRKDIEKIDKQSLVIVGEKDRLTPLDASIWLNKNIKASTLIKIAGANHMPFISHKEKVISSVINFINDN